MKLVLLWAAVMNVSIDQWIPVHVLWIPSGRLCFNFKLCKCDMCKLLDFFFTLIFLFLLVQRNFISIVNYTRSEILDIQSTEQRGRHQPRAGECVYQRGLGAGNTGRVSTCTYPAYWDKACMFSCRCGSFAINDWFQENPEQLKITLYTDLASPDFTRSDYSLQTFLTCCQVGCVLHPRPVERCSTGLQGPHLQLL